VEARLHCVLCVINISSSAADPAAPAAKRKKYLCQYKHEWTAQYPFLSGVSGNPTKAFCTLCRREFSVAHGRLNDVKVHVAGLEHKKNDRFATTSAAIDTFFAKTFSVEHQRVMAAELTSNLSHHKAALTCEIKLK